MGAQIEGIGSNKLTIQGVERLGGGEFTISPDYLEVGSFLGLGAVTRGEIRIHGVVPEHMRMINLVFADRLGVNMHMDGDVLVVDDEQDLCVREDIGGAVPKIDDAPWPQFPADLMSIALVVATQAKGTVLIHEKMFESRLYFVDKLITHGRQDHPVRSASRGDRRPVAAARPGDEQPGHPRRHGAADRRPGRTRHQHDRRMSARSTAATKRSTPNCAPWVRVTASSVSGIRGSEVKQAVTPDDIPAGIGQRGSPRPGVAGAAR